VAFVASEWFTDMEVLGNMYEVQTELEKKKCEENI
jgi:hypothetical protein